MRANNVEQIAGLASCLYMIYMLSCSRVACAFLTTVLQHHATVSVHGSDPYMPNRLRHRFQSAYHIFSV